MICRYALKMLLFGLLCLYTELLVCWCSWAKCSSKYSKVVLSWSCHMSGYQQQACIYLDTPQMLQTLLLRAKHASQHLRLLATP